LRQDDASGPSRRRKLRTANCASCVILASLREAGLARASIQAICESMWLHHVDRRRVLYCEGNGATHLFAIRSGRVKLVKSYTTGRARIVALLGPGDLLGFETIFDERYGATAEALTDCELCMASADQLQRMIAEVPRLATDLARYLHHQLARTRDRQVAITATGAPAKLAGYLLHSLVSRGATDEDRCAVPADLTLGDLGGILGISAETVCRALSQLRARGIVDSEPAGIVVRDVERLRRLARA